MDTKEIDRSLLQRVFACIDNTTLNATDNEQSVADFCQHTRAMRLHDGTTVAGVCVYPRFVAAARRALEGSGIRVVSVAGAFPHGQLPLSFKVEEVRQAVGDGADEVDIVISRGLLLEGEYGRAGEEVAAMRAACQGRSLKVILETCELPSAELVDRAAQTAIDAGADFIKTSTGKGTAGATLEAAEVMLNCIVRNVNFNKKTIGFKAAGGIRTPDEALAYARLAQKIICDDYINNQTFRIGASRLTDQLFADLTF